MATCIGDQFPLSRNAFYYVLPEPEAAFGAQVLPAVSDSEATSGTYTKTHAIAPLGCTMGFEQERSFTETAQGTRARLKDRIITGKLSATWSIETYLDVSDDAAVLKGPDIHHLLKAAIGDSATDTGAPARPVKFLPAATGNCLPTLNVVRTVPDTFSETVYGAAVDTMTLNMTSGDPIKISFSGMAYNHVLSGVVSANAGHDYTTGAAGTPIFCEPKINVYQLQPRTEIYDSSAIATENAATLWAWKSNEGATPGYTWDGFNKVDTIAEDAGTFISQTTASAGVPTFSTGPNDTGSVGSELRMVPFFPEGGSEFGTAKPLSSTQGTVTITPLLSDDSTDLAVHPVITTAPITSLEITLANNIKAIDDQSFTASSFAGFIPGFRDVTGTISMRVKTDVQGLLLNRRELFRRCAVEVVLGDASARRVQIDMAFVEFETSSIESSGQDEMTVSIPFKSMVSDTTAAEVVKDLVIEWK